MGAHAHKLDELLACGVLVQVINRECQQAMIGALVTTHSLSEGALRYASYFVNLIGAAEAYPVRGWGARALWLLLRFYRERGVNLVGTE